MTPPPTLSTRGRFGGCPTIYLIASFPPIRPSPIKAPPIKLPSAGKRPIIWSALTSHTLSQLGGARSTSKLWTSYSRRSPHFDPPTSQHRLRQYAPGRMYSEICTYICIYVCMRLPPTNLDWPPTAAQLHFRHFFLSRQSTFFYARLSTATSTPTAAT